MAASETCSRCGEEVRWGTRGSITGYLHRLDADHVPIFGTPWSPELVAALEEQARLPRTMEDGTVYTTLEFDIIERDKDPERRRRRLALARGEDPDAPPAPLPPVEVPKHDLDVKSFAATSGIAQLHNLASGVTRVTPDGKSTKVKKHPPMAPGWEVRRFTGARGPYLGADGSVLSISDTVVLGARGPDQKIAVAAWRDGQFDTGYVGVIIDGAVRVEAANSTEVKQWLKGELTPGWRESILAE